MADSIITINKEAIILSRDQAGDIILTQEAEGELRKVLEFKKLAEEVYEWVQDKLSEAMSQQKIKKIVSGNLVVSQRLFGERYAIQESTEETYTKEVAYKKANAEEIDKYVENHGDLPEGVTLKERSLKATISTREAE